MPELRRIADELGRAKVIQGLKGLPDSVTIDVLAKQFVASLRREDYYRKVQSRSISSHRADPNSASFDAERAVAFHMQQGNVEEAGWLIFLMTHFARRADTRWLRLQDVYGRLGSGIWTWEIVTTDPAAFYYWLSANWQSIGGAFGNHRKYESLRPDAKRPMSKTVENYLTWIGPGGHAAFFAGVVLSAGNDPHTIFDRLYRSLEVASFGRLAKFDYLSLVGRFRLAPIEPGSAYLDGATGPGRGARLLIDGIATSTTNNEALQSALNILDSRLTVGMAVMEDALCNWQKSPRHFVHYTG